MTSTFQYNQGNHQECRGRNARNEQRPLGRPSPRKPIILPEYNTATAFSTFSVCGPSTVCLSPPKYGDQVYVYFRQGKNRPEMNERMKPNEAVYLLFYGMWFSSSALGLSCFSFIRRSFLCFPSTIPALFLADLDR